MRKIIPEKYFYYQKVDRNPISRILSICIIIFLTCSNSIYPNSNADTIKVVNIAQEKGLSQLNALSLEFDNLGYLWIGTENGLNRYNGYQIKVFKAGSQSNSLRDDHIRGMYHSNDTLWLATNTHSVSAFLLKENRFINLEDSININESPGTKFTYNITPVDGRYLLAGSIDNCILIDRLTLKCTVIKITGKTDNEYVTNTIRYNNKILIGTNYNGTYIFDISTKEIEPFLFNKLEVNSFYDIGNGYFLIGTNSGLYKHKTGTKITEKINAPHGLNVIRNIFKWDEENIFIGGINRNFLLSEDNTFKEIVFTNQNDKPVQSTILSFAIDKQGGRWLGTEGRGVFYYHPNQKKFIPNRIIVENAPKKDFISMFNFEKEGDTLWMATEFGFVRYLENEDEYKLYLTNNLEYTIVKGLNGTLWAGGFGEGLVRYDRKNDTFRHVPLDVKDKDVIHITPITTDSIWVHTWSEGIYSLNVNTNSTQKISIKGESLIRSRNSFIDSSGDIWLASDNGLYQISGDNQYYYDSLTNERVFDITEDSNHNIWIGTGKGLNRLDKETGIITHYYEQEGLPNDFIYGVESDIHDNIWVSTNYGLSVFNQETRTFKNYTEADGLQNNEFNGKAAFKSESGRLYFGGMNGFNAFNPEKIFINENPGKIIIEEIELFGKAIDNYSPHTKQLEFQHNQNVITFNYVNLSYLYPEKNHYQFMLEGFDTDWRPITSERSTTYTNLDPGTYVFKVRGSNNDLIWGDETEVLITIRSPWYATTWFKISIIIFGILLITTIFLIRDRQQKSMNLKLSKMVEERTKELTRINEVLKDSLELTKKQKENISFLMRELNHRVKNNLQLITSLIDFQNFDDRNISQEVKLKQLQTRIFTVSKIHDLLNPTEIANDEISIDLFIEKLTLDIANFSGSDIIVNTASPSILINSKKLTYLGLILNELITNSIKHAFPISNSKEIKLINIEVKESDYKIHILYHDNGIGFSETEVNDTSSMGLQLINAMTEELGGVLSIVSEKGSTFKFEFDKSKLIDTDYRNISDKISSGRDN
ncbi:ligand-binding sensor domain-containing protein [Marinigracilibium pacificum]|uniref:Histidine kinase domain-containing protein n=1 Tax=Marinigracilibium pacificum TaxID=2729599 RepID=A0A848J1W1_9BACT|nr:triple tyrosine motif-containing protein [Marinigracilibium pacificum]NMM50813.1 hypothetical protein [Marinigracilibium pacificum]